MEGSVTPKYLPSPLSSINSSALSLTWSKESEYISSEGLGSFSFLGLRGTASAFSFHLTSSSICEGSVSSVKDSRAIVAVRFG